MKLTMKVAALAVILFSSSCAMMFNDKEVEVRISSAPQGANIFIDGKSYGVTPATIRIVPKNYIATITKEGYGSTQLKLEAWAAIRNKPGDRGRCIADALGTMLILPYYSLVYSGACSEFKQPEYHVVIPNLGSGAGAMKPNSASLIGAGQDPRSMVNYYYGSQQMPAESNSKNAASPRHNYR